MFDSDRYNSDLFFLITFVINSYTINKSDITANYNDNSTLSIDFNFCSSTIVNTEVGTPKLLCQDLG